MADDNKDQARRSDAMAEARAKIATNQASKEAMAEHTVEEGETLSRIALHYYGNAGEMYWRHIYEANKEVIGDNPGMIKPGQVFQIPPKPEEEGGE